MITQKEINDIHKLCLVYNINRYTINDDGTIDVDYHVDLSNNGLTELPLRFNKVDGNFWCAANILTTLKGAPSYVSGSFNCNNNRLSSLEGGPTYVGGYFTCVQNNLTSIQYAPKDFYSFSFSETPIFIGLYKKLGRLTLDGMKILIKYQNEYDVWNPEFNEKNFDDLVDDIKDGLE